MPSSVLTGHSADANAEKGGVILSSMDPIVVPSGHTSLGGVVVGHTNANQKMLLFEDPQCPYCRQFEEINGPSLTSALADGEIAVEYRMRCFLGPESVRADNALALAAEAGEFDELRRTLFAAQPPEGTGGFATEELLRLGAEVGLTAASFVSGVRQARYEKWVLRQESIYQSEDPQGTPAAWIDGKPIDPDVLFDRRAFKALLRRSVSPGSPETL
jgi:protein-disulfide isomerase